MIQFQVDDTEIINFLLTTEIIPLCLKTMEMGSELSKTVATFIVQKILLDNVRSFRLQPAGCLLLTSALLAPFRHMKGCRSHGNGTI